MTGRTAIRGLLRLWLLSAAARAGAEPATTLTGTVRDESGVGLPGVVVELDAAGGGRPTVFASTDASGTYAIAALAEGRHRIAFHLPGFATSVETVSVEAGSSAQVDAILRVALSAEVLVTSQRTFRSLTDLDEPANGLLGLASAGSEGVVASRVIEERPAYRAAEIFEAVPGVVISQHSGEGKANQYYVRGFNIDHGTDLATFVAGVPVNMPSHGHGQGYSDNIFLIPELVRGVQYQKGTYSAEQGDFSAAGSINVNYLDLLDRPLAKLEGGGNGFGRVLLASSSRVGDGQVLYAAEAHHSDGPWTNPDDYRKLIGVVRYSRGNQRNGSSLTAMGYSGRWHSTDQIPERAIRSRLLDRFDAVDATDRDDSEAETERSRRGPRGPELVLPAARKTDESADAAEEGDQNAAAGGYSSLSAARGWTREARQAGKPHANRPVAARRMAAEA